MLEISHGSKQSSVWFLNPKWLDGHNKVDAPHIGTMSLRHEGLKINMYTYFGSEFWWLVSFTLRLFHQWWKWMGGPQIWSDHGEKHWGMPSSEMLHRADTDYMLSFQKTAITVRNLRSHRHKNLKFLKRNILWSISENV